MGLCLEKSFFGAAVKWGSKGKALMKEEVLGVWSLGPQVKKYEDIRVQGRWMNLQDCTLWSGWLGSNPICLSRHCLYAPPKKSAVYVPASFFPIHLSANACSGKEQGMAQICGSCHPPPWEAWREVWTPDWPLWALGERTNGSEIFLSFSLSNKMKIKGNAHPPASHHYTFMDYAVKCPYVSLSHWDLLWNPPF